MRRKEILIVPLICLLLASCNKASSTPTISAGIFTAVAQTLTAQYTPVVATETPLPSETPTQITPTLYQTQDYVLPTTSSCDNAAYVDDITYEDNTIVAPGEEIAKTWSIRNTGTCAWTLTYKLKFVSGSQMSGKSIAVGESVAPGKSVEISVNMVAPSTTGTYTGYWQMSNDSGTLFGGYVSIKIIVGNTPTLAITGTVTKTPTPSVTPVVITVIVTAVPTNTVTPTDVPVLFDTPVTPEVYKSSGPTSG